VASLRRFPYKHVRAKIGTIGGFLFENRHIKLPRTLFHSIEIPLDPFEIVHFDGNKKRLKTSLSFEFIQLPDQPFRGYRALVGRTFEFPTNPEEGYIDASIYLCGAHNMIDVAELSFLGMKRGLLEVRITMAIDFESEGTGYANTDALAVEVALRPGAIRIDDEILKKAKRKKPRALLADFVEGGILGEAVTEEGRVGVRLREG
jgi:hypothetical protein